MKKYFQIFLLELQVQFQYRLNLVMWLLLGGLSTTVVTLVWLSILGNRAEVGGFSGSDFVIYFVYMVLSWYLIGGSFARQLGGAIKQGEINKTLVKPYNVMIEEIVKEQAWKVMSVVVTLPAVMVLLYVFRGYLVFSIGITEIPVLLVAIMCGAVLFASIEAVVACVAFWVTEVWPFVDLYNILLNILGGVMAPIVLLPTVVGRIANVLPFKYIYYGPAMIMLGKISNGWQVVAIQLLYIVLFQIILRIVWSAGLRRYEGNGG